MTAAGPSVWASFALMRTAAILSASTLGCQGRARLAQSQPSIQRQPV